MTSIDRIIDLSLINSSDLPPAALLLARYSFLDWLVCGIAGIDEPLAQKMRVLAESEAGAETASVFGGRKAPSRMAALVNGSTSHALDFDDTHFAHIGHLSVAIYPAALALAEECGLAINAVVEAFVVGAESAIRIGIALGAQHYNHGFHQTATAGAFGATVAAGRLLALNEQQMRNAIGLCATRASGLKSQFGTMGKPYNAGVAAANGVECARLAALDFTSCHDGLTGGQGFFATHSTDVDEARAWRIPLSERFLFEDNKYKLHACCHGLHAMIEALRGPQARDLSLSDIRTVIIETNPRWLLVCDKKEPRTGLEVKFSYAWLSGMTLRGDATGSDKHYTDRLAQDPELIDFAKKVSVIGTEVLTDMQAIINIELNDGRQVQFFHDLSDPLREQVLEEKLRDKAKVAIGVEGERVWALLGSLNDRSARSLDQLMCR